MAAMRGVIDLVTRGRWMERWRVIGVDEWPVPRLIRMNGWQSQSPSPGCRSFQKAAVVPPSTTAASLFPVTCFSGAYFPAHSQRLTCIPVQNDLRGPDE